MLDDGRVAKGRECRDERAEMPSVGVTEDKGEERIDL